MATKPSGIRSILNFIYNFEDVKGYPTKEQIVIWVDQLKNVFKQWYENKGLSVEVRDVVNATEGYTISVFYTDDGEESWMHKAFVQLEGLVELIIYRHSKDLQFRDGKIRKWFFENVNDILSDNTGVYNPPEDEE